MGGTSAAAPHVGAAVLLLQDAGITNPMATKALLINSADAWTDSGVPGPDDPKIPYNGGHHPVIGSHWSPTYGGGYMNMQKAFEQRTHIIEDQISLDQPTKEYHLIIPATGKVTLIHERRVGYFKNHAEWQLSALSLAIYDGDTQKLIAQDLSTIDSVHQVANCPKNSSSCATNTTNVIVRVSLNSQHIDGSDYEPFVLVYD